MGDNNTFVGLKIIELEEDEKNEFKESLVSLQNYLMQKK